MAKFGDTSVYDSLTGAEVAADDQFGIWDTSTGRFKLIVPGELQTALGIGPGLDYLAGLGFTDEATFKAAVNLEPGTDVQAYSANLDSWSAVTPSDYQPAGDPTSSAVEVGSAISLTTATPANLTSLSLAAGEWDLSLTAYYLGAATTNVTRLLTSISTASATLQTMAGQFHDRPFPAAGVVVGDSRQQTANVGPWRVSPVTTTTYYAVVFGNFTVDTLSAWGRFEARQVG